MRILIKDGRVLDPATHTDAKLDILVEDGVIAKRDVWIDEKEITADSILWAHGCYVMPGLIDLHVHLREPGFEHKETIETGTKAMAKGGFTAVCPMPNTKPATDSPERITWLLEKAEQVSPIHILPVGAVTLGQEGKEVTDIAGMAQAGAMAISEDGKSVMDTAVYREAMIEAAKNDLVVMAHCEDKNLVGKGCMNAGEKADEFGVPGISNAVEDVIVARDILLAKETGAKLHLCHCSTKDSVAMIRAAKEAGLPVSGEVCPHHFAMSTDDMDFADANFKMNPPLRTKEDVEALKEGLRTGVIDAISTDHAPHAKEEKEKPITEAPFGIVGSETAVALTITHLVETGVLTPYMMAEKMSYNPAKILGIDRGTLEVGAAADITIIDPSAEYVIDPETFVSKGKNTPFAGHKVRGQVRYTIVNGKIVYDGRKEVTLS
jgi:dihydroorotase